MESLGASLSTESIYVIGFVVAMYIVVITMFGGYFARFNKDINDFFYSGQRFAWWLPAASMVATGIGSYSYLKYSQQGYETGMSSALTYMNDWFIVPFFMFGWLPIIYFARVHSIPEYFERRFNRTARYIALVIILAYMLYYIGYNLFTIGIAIDGMFGVPLIWSVPIVGIFLGAYVTFGGQTAVIFTDLFQGFMLYLAGGLAIFTGIYALGGFDDFWAFLPTSHRLPFVHLTSDPKFNTAGLFWGEALAGSIAFTFMNQGFIMRYLTIKSVNDGRKAALFNVCCTLPLSAVIVGAVGWIAKSLVTKQAVTGGALAGMGLIEIANPFHTFLVVVWETVYHNPWIFGFIIAALMAALMSTIDTLINACAAIGIYDIYKPLMKPEASDAHYLKAARWASIISTGLGLLIVWLFIMQQQSDSKLTLMSLHYKGIMIIIPAIVTTIFLGAFWSRFNSTAAIVSMVAGSTLTVLTNWNPEWVDFLSQLVSGPSLAENKYFIFMPSLFGMLVSAIIGVITTYLTTPADHAHTDGLTIDSLDIAMESYKGGTPNHTVGEKLKFLNFSVKNEVKDDYIMLNPDDMKRLAAENDDMIYIEDSRWWLGGLRSKHVKCMADSSIDAGNVVMNPTLKNETYLQDHRKVTLEKIF